MKWYKSDWVQGPIAITILLGCVFLPGFLLACFLAMILPSVSFWDSNFWQTVAWTDMFVFLIFAVWSISDSG